ncbi:MAG: hypothetical protein IT449_12850 [Phycisphaerales bacterium]|nr:hypothetical protein [Phycisphaerales bacterium]
MIEEYADGDDKLILKATSTCSNQSCSMTLRGDGHIKVNIDNRAYVIADDHIWLEDRAKTGTSDGWWWVKEAGTLEISAEVTGASAWYVDSDSADNKVLLIEDSGCVKSSGPVTLLGGELSCPCGTTFCTTGKLTWKSIAVGQNTTEPLIRTTSTSVATFGLGGSGTCSCTTSCP